MRISTAVNCLFCNGGQSRRFIQFLALTPLVFILSLSFSIDALANGECSVPTNVSPAGESELANGSQTLSWDDTGCMYWVYAGTAADSRTYDDSGNLGDATSYTFGGNPSDG